MRSNNELARPQLTHFFGPGLSLLIGRGKGPYIFSTYRALFRNPELNVLNARRHVSRESFQAREIFKKVRAGTHDEQKIIPGNRGSGSVPIFKSCVPPKLLC